VSQPCHLLQSLTAGSLQLRALVTFACARFVAGHLHHLHYSIMLSIIVPAHNARRSDDSSVLGYVPVTSGPVDDKTLVVLVEAATH
jgi:hypothetical protein